MSDVVNLFRDATNPNMPDGLRHNSKMHLRQVFGENNEDNLDKLIGYVMGLREYVKNNP